LGSPSTKSNPASDVYSTNVVESGRWHGLWGASGYQSTQRHFGGPTHSSQTTARPSWSGQGAFGDARTACCPTKESSRFSGEDVKFV